MNAEIILSKLNNLNIDPSRAVITGSALLDVLGIRESNDLDIIIDKETFDSLRQDDRYTLGAFSDGSEKIDATGDVELMYDWYGQTVDDCLRESTTIDGVNFFSLQSIRTWKKRQARPKDLRDIELIDAYLAKQASDEPLAN